MTPDLHARLLRLYCPYPFCILVGEDLIFGGTADEGVAWFETRRWLVDKENCIAKGRTVNEIQARIASA